jgi:hypothetical protein
MLQHMQWRGHIYRLLAILIAKPTYPSPVDFRQALRINPGTRRIVTFFRLVRKWAAHRPYSCSLL